MSGVKLVGDWSKLEKALSRFGRFSFLSLHKNIGEQLRANTRERFRRQKGPDDKPWVKSFRAKNEKGKTLMDSRDLYNSLTYKASPQKVEMGTNKIYASTHQDGSTIKARKSKHLKFKVAGGFVSKKKVTIPARPFMGINDNDYDDIEIIVHDHIEEALR